MSDILQSLPPVRSIGPDRVASLRKEGRYGTLALHFMREGFLYSKKVCRGKLPDDEIYSLTFKALKAAARKFDPKRGDFFVFGKIYLRWEIKHAWTEKDLVKNSSTESIAQVDFTDGSPLHDDQHGRVDWPVNNPESFPNEPSVEFDFETVDFREKMEMLRPIIAELSPTERSIIELRFETGWDFARIGVKIDLSRERVRQIALGALNKIRERVSREYPIT